MNTKDRQGDFNIFVTLWNLLWFYIFYYSRKPQQLRLELALRTSIPRGKERFRAVREFTKDVTRRYFKTEKDREKLETWEIMCVLSNSGYITKIGYWSSRSGNNLFVWELEPPEYKTLWKLLEDHVAEVDKIKAKYEWNRADAEDLRIPLYDD